jgi:hypothetical protein
MNNEIRLTLIATGFDSQLGMSGVAREKEITKVLKGLKAEELDTPSFLRQRNIPQQPRTVPTEVTANKVRQY